MGTVKDMGSPQRSAFSSQSRLKAKGGVRAIHSRAEVENIELTALCQRAIAAVFHHLLGFILFDAGCETRGKPDASAMSEIQEADEFRHSR
jgi:hypothetical protein